MKPLALQPRLVEQAYEAVLDEICDGALPPGTHLVQEQLAARLGVSRQPVQQALLLLKSDGLLQDAGRRGLVVAPVDLGMMRHRYQIRATLDALAARLAAEQCAAVPAVAAAVERDGERIVAAGMEAVATGCVHDMVARDVAFHAFLYEASGNPLLGPTAQRHWRYLRRVMGEVLRRAEPPRAIWRQHREILGAIVAGDPERGEGVSRPARRGRRGPSAARARARRRRGGTCGWRLPGRRRLAPARTRRPAPPGWHSCCGRAASTRAGKSASSTCGTSSGSRRRERAT